MTTATPVTTPRPPRPGELMPALTMAGPRDLRLRMVPAPAARPGHCVVRIAYVGLCGADASFYDGSSMYLREGLKHYPFIFGHEWSGTVVEVADDVRGFARGDRVAGHNFVTCDACPECRAGRRVLCRARSEMGILGDYPGVAGRFACVPAKVLTPLPATVGGPEAALLEPSSTALHAVRRTGVQDTDSVLVYGTGTLGLVTMQLARARGASVHVAGVERYGLDLAGSLGADGVLTPRDVEHDRYDVVIEASGAVEAAAQAPSALAYGGRLGLVGVPHHPVPHFPAASLVVKSATVHGVLSGIDDWDRLLGVIGRGGVALAPLIDHVYPYRRADEAFERLAQPDRARPKVLLDFGSEEE
ncbi:alcohol dehydrogenase catalytic domain-containing protein [Nonomuraea sp. B1E8]|uniref:zinc-dependent alcohol dehydrogenase n=1 Tax=unclassified Nonomuraea TaxID=2593643 RepID=UPI00325CAC72